MNLGDVEIMKLTESELIKRNEPILLHNTIILDSGKLDKYEYGLMLLAALASGGNRTLHILFNTDMSADLWDAISEWVRALRIFETDTDVFKVPQHLTETHGKNMVDYLNRMFNMGDDKVCGIFVAVITKSI